VAVHRDSGAGTVARSVGPRTLQGVQGLGHGEKGSAGRWSASSRGHGGRHPRPGVRAGERAAAG
jgi:hypothetical protein